MKKFWLFTLVILIGGLAGILGSQFLAPYLSRTAPFDRLGWLKQSTGMTTIINPKEEKIINEATAVEDAISRLSQSVVGVEVRSAVDKAASREKPLYGSGFIVTSDGLILTASFLASADNLEYFIYRNGEKIPAEIVRNDVRLGFLLLKIAQTNLPVVSFIRLKDLRLGARVVLLAIDAAKEPTERFVNLGIIKFLDSKHFFVSIDSEAEKAAGAPLFTVTGEVAGMAQISEEGALTVVPTDVIREFLEK